MGMDVSEPAVEKRDERIMIGKFGLFVDVYATRLESVNHLVVSSSSEAL